MGAARPGPPRRLVAAAGVIAGFVAWIGAVLNSLAAREQGLVRRLVLPGVFNFGFFAMVAYIIAGPDGKAAPSTQPAPAAVGA